MNKDDFIYLDKNIIVRKDAIRWMRKLDDCIQVCANTKSCTPFSTYNSCKKTEPASYEFLNDFLESVKNNK